MAPTTQQGWACAEDLGGVRWTCGGDILPDRPGEESWSCTGARGLFWTCRSDIDVGERYTQSWSCTHPPADEWACSGDVAFGTEFGEKWACTGAQGGAAWTCTGDIVTETFHDETWSCSLAAGAWFCHGNILPEIASQTWSCSASAGRDSWMCQGGLGGFEPVVGMPFLFFDNRE